jgi:hypothetical protein
MSRAVGGIPFNPPSRMDRRVKVNPPYAQPLSLQGQVGVSIAAGLESLELRPGR